MSIAVPGLLMNKLCSVMAWPVLTTTIKEYLLLSTLWWNLTKTSLSPRRRWDPDGILFKSSMYSGGTQIGHNKY